jgi:hypothetical protein
LTVGNWTPAALWLAVIASGLFHGVNPGMGWPLALSAGLMERSTPALFAALVPLTAGHLLAMLIILFPFSLLVTLIEWRTPVQIAAAVLVIGFGAFRLLNRRHPKALARIRPAQLGLWSFAVAIAHGAGLMLAPIYLGLCRRSDLDHSHYSFAAFINADLLKALAVVGVHSIAMVAAGGCLAWLTYRYIGSRFVSQSWINLDPVWALSLILVGSVSVTLNLIS